MRELYHDLTEGKLKITEGQKLTVAQKRAIGELESANMSALFQPKMVQAAGNAVKNAEAIAERLNSYGNIKIDKNGRLVVVGNDTSSAANAAPSPQGEGLRDITAEDIRAGFDEKSGKQAFAKAIQNNEVLRYVAASDVAGRLIMSVEQFEKTSLEGTTIKNQVDLNEFIESASDEKKAALGRELGIADDEWATMSLRRFNQAAAAYRESGKLDQRRAEMQAAEQKKNAYVGEAVGGENSGISGLTNTERGNVSVSGEDSLNNSENSLNNSENSENSENSLSPSARMAIDVSTNGTPFVTVKEDILDGVDEKDWIKTVKSNLSSKFPNGVTLGNNVVEIDRQSRKEMTYSKYMQWLRATNPQAFSDKLRATNNAEEILTATQGWVSEGLNHPRNDSIVDFARGTVLLRIGSNDYSASVVVGTHKNGKMMLYDIIDLAPTKITKKETGEAIPENSSRRAERKTTPISTDSIPDSEGKVNTSAENSSEKSSKEKIAEAKERIDKKKIDAYLRENVEDYAGLSAANQSMIRQIVREGRVYGLDEADILSYARVAAHSGLNIEFQPEMRNEKLEMRNGDVAASGGIAGYYDPENNRIVVNPKATKKQELILIHELDHAVRKFLRLDGGVHTLVYKGAEQRLSSETWEQIQKDYADQDVDVSREELLADEASAYYTEAILGPKITIDMLLGCTSSTASGSPSPQGEGLAKKILSFFTGAARAYSGDAKLSREARRHYKNFKKMFDAFAERNKGRNAETAVEAVDNGKLTVASGNVRKSADSASQDLYSYASLVSKKEIEIKKLESISDNEIQKYKNDSILFGKDMRENAAKRNNTKNTDTRTYLYCKDLNKDILITRESFKHGAERMDAAYITISKNIDKILETSIVINEVLSRENTNGGYVLLGVAEIGENYTFVRSVINKKTWKLEEYEELSAIKKTSIKKEDVGFKPPHYIQENGYETSSIISIHDLLENVKSINLVNEVFSEDVAKKLGVTRTKGTLTPSLRFSKDIEPTLAEDGTGKPVGDLFDKHGRKVDAVRSVAESRFRKEILDRFEYSNSGNVVTRDLIDYHLGKNAIAMLEAEAIEVESANGVTEGTLKENASSAKLGGTAMNNDIGLVSVVPSRIKGYASRQLSARDAMLFSSLKSIIENGRVVGFSHPDGVLFEEIRIAAPAKLGDELTYAEITVRRNDAGGASYVYDVAASENIKKTLEEASTPAKNKRLSDKLGTAKPVDVSGNTKVPTEASDTSAEPEATNEQMLSPELYSLLRSSGGRLRITEAVYKRLVKSSDKATAQKIKGRWGYSRGSKYKAADTLSVKDFVKEIARFREIKALEGMSAAEALIEIDRLWRINKDGGKAYRFEKENERLKAWNKELRDKNRGNLLSQVDYLARKLSELKDGRFLNASQYRTGELKSSILKLAGIKWRGKESARHARTLARSFSEWYDTKNEMLGYISDDNPGLYDADMKATLEEIARGTEENLTNDELEDLIRVLEFAKTFAERFDKIYDDGKWVDSLPEAQRHVKAAQKSQRPNSRWVAFKHAVFSFLKALGDPLSVVKMADRYNPDGFFTTFYKRIERAEMNARVTEMETLGDFDKFFDKKENKGYAKKLMQEEHEYLGHKLRKTQLIDLYMSLKSQTALPGLAFSGFEFTNKQGYEERVDGFVGPDAWSELWSTSEIERAAAWKRLNRLAAEQRAAIEKQLTAQDMEYISILEAGYLKTKALKDGTDKIKFGYERTKSGYYLPTVRANVAKSVQNPYTRVDLVNNISANKHTKEGATSELYIGDSTAKFKGHVNAISNYANLSVEIDNYNKIFNLDVNDNPNKPTSVKTETVNAWRSFGLVGKNGAKMTKEHGGNAYIMSIIESITGTPQVKGAFNSFIGRIRGRYAQFVLGANWKSWFSQMQSWIAASSEYSIGDMLKGVGLLRKGTFGDMDKYCSLAKLRNYDDSAAKAQGVLDEVKGIGAVTMKPTSLVDRFVCALDFCAAQVEVERTQGFKVGSKENLKAAGERLAEVILRTQQNTLASSKNAAARSGSEFAKSIVMFQSDAIKTTGRGIDGLGEYFTLRGERRAMKNNGATAEELADIDKRISEAGKRALKANFALVMGAIFAVVIGRIASDVFYGWDEEEEEKLPLSLTLDFVGNMLGGLPLIDDAWNSIVDGYEINDSGYSTINDLFDSVGRVQDIAAKIAEGKLTSQDSASAVRDTVFAFSTLFGIPTKNLYKTARGIIRIASPNTLYKLESVTDVKNFSSDFEEAIEAGDEEKAAMILEMLLAERLSEVKGNSEEVIGAGGVSEALREEMLIMRNAGYNLLPRTIGSTVTIAGEEIEMSAEEQAALRARYSEAIPSIEGLIGGSAYSSLTDEQKEKAVRFVYDVYYDAGIYELYGYERNMKRRIFSKVIAPEKLALANAVTAGLESDYEDERGKTISLEKWATIKGTTARVNYSTVSGSKRKKVIAAINKLPLTTAEKLLIIAYKGYSIKDGDIKGVSAERAKQMLSRYAKAQGLTKDEAKALEEYL